MVKVVAKSLISEGKVEEVIKLYQELVQETRKEDGCIKYELYQDGKDTKTLAVIEEWESKEALDNHMKTEHFTRIVPMIGEFVVEKTVNIYNKLI